MLFQNTWKILEYILILEHILLYLFNYVNVLFLVSKLLTELFHTSIIYENANHDKTQTH